MVQRGSIKEPSESLGKTYELGLNASCSNKKNLVASEGVSTPSGTGAGGGLPTGACSRLIGSRPLWIVGRAVLRLDEDQSLCRVSEQMSYIHLDEDQLRTR